MITEDLAKLRSSLAAFGLLLPLMALLTSTAAVSQSVDLSMYSGMRWRLVGPFRAGRVTTVCGVPSEPATYYMGTPGGGVWKTSDGGRVWRPIFDEEHVASIGALAVSPSNPEIIYVGTGEQTRGNGMYKSTDAGASWTKVGLEEERYIDSVVIDARNPDIVLVAASGDYESGPVGGVFKTTNGGTTWQKVLSRPDATGAADLSPDPDRSGQVFAALWHRNFDESFDEAASAKPDGWLYKSNDEGSTWEPLQGKGWPTGGVGRIGVAVSPQTRGQRVFAIVSEGLFRSDDGGANWQRVTTDPRIVGNSYFSRVFVDPRNADIVYVVQTSLYRSTDGGKTFEAFAGAPSGDDFHVLWINPYDSRHMILGVDQGAIISVDGGETWTSWYNQPTGQFYNVSVDHQFPYYLYAAQQDSGTVAVPNRSDYGESSFRDWFSPGGFEIGYIVADPLYPNLVYAAGWYNSVVRFDRTTGQIAHVFVRSGKDRASMAMPMAFSPQDQHVLYLGTQALLKTTDGGMSWQVISPDLTRGPPKESESTHGFEAPKHAISTLAPSPLVAGQIWAATDDGLVQLTQDGGGSWHNVAPPKMTPQSSFAMLEASHHDAGAAYAALMVMHDSRPYAFRTHDYGKSWQKIAAGLPDHSVVRVVREDPQRNGLLYAGTETGVYVSFDDGDHWQPLQFNLPTSSVRDLAVHEGDLVAATFGRGLWILDDLSPLRQLGQRSEDVHFFQPQTAIRVRWDVNQDTPLPRETPAGQNPPDGAIFDYFLSRAPSDQVMLAIHDQHGQLVRQFTSRAELDALAYANVPNYWFGAPAVLPKQAGLNRFIWNLRYPDPPTLSYGYSGRRLDYVEYTLADHAIPGETPRHQPQGPLVVPGNYEVRLTLNGRTYRQPLTVRLDPRVNVPQSALVEQLDVARAINSWMATSYAAHNQISKIRAALSERQKALGANSSASDVLKAIRALDGELGDLQEGTSSKPGFGLVNRDLARLATMVDSGDAAPSQSARAAAAESCLSLANDLERWNEAVGHRLASLNALLQTQNLDLLPQTSNVANPECSLH
jgi:photosystem II stability/assembly factor-like uncharacterized protein